MGLSNDTILAGHLSIGINWGGGGHPRQVVDATRTSFLDDFVKRPAIAGKIEYTDMIHNKLDVITPGTEGAKKVNKSAYSNAVAPGDYAARVWKALTQYGFPGNSIDFVYAQCYMESGHWTSNAAKKDLNPGNIMNYPGSGYKNGTYIPSNKTYVIHFRTLDEFAAELYKTLNKGSYPLLATTLEDYVKRVIDNGYSSRDNYTSYLRKMQVAMDALDSDNQKYADKYQKQESKKDKDRSRGSFIDWMKQHPIITGVTVTLGGLIVLKTLARR